MTTSTAAHDTFIIERDYDQPVTQVFRAWSDPARKARWFTGSTDALGNGYELEFRVGGREVSSGGPPGGPLDTYEAVFRDIVADQRIVYTYEMHADDDRISVSVTTVEFRNDGSTTHLRLTEQGVYLDGHDTSAQRQGGVGAQLDALGASLQAADG